MKLLPLVALAMLPLTIRAGDDKAVKKEIDKIQGTWIMAELRYNGRDLSGDDKSKFKLVFKGDTAVVEGVEELTKEYAKVSFKFDPAAKPKIVDLKILSGSQKDAVIEGIYELNDKEFKICANVFGNNRPSEFAAPEGSSSVLVVLKRE